LAVLRARLPRLHRPRAHHRHFQADAARPPLRPALRGPGADRPTNRRHPGGDAPAPWRRGLPGGPPPLHPHARRAGGGVPDPDYVLAGRIRRQPLSALRVLRRLRVAPMTALAPLETLFDDAQGTDLSLPVELADLYGRLRLPPHPGRPHV